MAASQAVTIPEAFRADVERAVQILRAGGCTDVFVFGSVAAGDAEAADLDLAVRGCPPDRFFHLLGRLLMELDHPVDLVDLDVGGLFAEYLEQEGELVQVG
jgi:predicted nucleotidyltransferase